MTSYAMTPEDAGHQSPAGGRDELSASWWRQSPTRYLKPGPCWCNARPTTERCRHLKEDVRLGARERDCLQWAGATQVLRPCRLRRAEAIGPVRPAAAVPTGRQELRLRCDSILATGRDMTRGAAAPPHAPCPPSRGEGTSFSAAILGNQRLHRSAEFLAPEVAVTHDSAAVDQPCGWRGADLV
jgi:hypothetical protein